MQAYHDVFILSTSKSAGIIELEVSNLMKLLFLGGGDKGCASDNHQITTGKQHRDTVGI